MRTAAVARLALALAFAGALVSMPLTVRADEAALQPPAGEVLEARAQIEATIAQMRATSLRVREQLRTTRKRGTKRQITCVDEALSRSDVGVRRARETGDEALAAYQRGDADTARALRVRLSEIREAQRVAAVEGSSCAPAVVVASAAGVTTVKLSVDPKIPAPPP